MGALAEDSIAAKSWGERLWVVVAVVVGLSVASALAYWLFTTLSKPSPPTRQVTRIAIIPDTPPPPPPPPKEEKRPEPPKDQKEVKVEQPKPVEAPPQQAEQLKMEGAAGDGPSPFAAGSVTNEYKGGDVGTAISGSVAAKVNPAVYRSYANTLTRQIEQHLSQIRELRGIEYDASAKIWLAADRRFERAELYDSSNDQSVDAVLTRELSKLYALYPPPAGIPQPIRIRVKNRFAN